jgi:hypothetical protein
MTGRLVLWPTILAVALVCAFFALESVRLTGQPHIQYRRLP